MFHDRGMGSPKEWTAEMENNILFSSALNRIIHVTVSAKNFTKPKI